VPTLEGAPESQFVHRVHVGATVLPYRLRSAPAAVLPWDGERLLDMTDPAIEEYPGLLEWWQQAERVWTTGRSATTVLSLRGQIDYQRKLSNQFPVRPQRVVYTKSGTYLAAARLDDPAAVCDSSLYWGAVANEDEGRYLCAIFNSSIFGARIAPLQSQGQFGARHFDKYVFAVPFPQFDPNDDLLSGIASAATDAEEVAAATPIPDSVQFQAARTLVRQALVEHGVAGQIEALVGELLERHTV